MNLEKLNLPVTHDKCPVCGSEKGLIKQAMEELRQEGKLNKTSFPLGCVIPSPLLDPTHPPPILTNSVKVPVINLYYEVCAEPECGALYCTRFDVTEQAIPDQFQRLLGFGKQLL
jgi:hypothetical protein